MKTIEYVHREIEKKLGSLVKNFPAVVVTGPRQSGKSTLLRKIFGKKYFYLTFDDPVVREQAIMDPRLFLENAGERMIIDEIQYVPELLSYVKILIDQDREKRGRFIFTGSQQFALMKHLGDSLAGRIAIIELFPFSVIEKKKIISKKNFSTTTQYFSHACLKGSFPEIVTNLNIENEFWYGSYIQTYLERDIRTFYNIGNLRDFQRFLHLLAARCAQILNLSSLAVDLGVAVNTLKHWLSVLEASRIIYLLQPYYNNLGKRVVKSPKVYFMDCALVCYLLSIKDQNSLMNGPMAGPLFENFCIQETVKTLANKAKRIDLYYLRTHNGLEVDLILEKDGQIFPVEFKLSKTPTIAMGEPMRLFRQLFSKLNPAQGMILSLYEKNTVLTRDVSLVNMDEYLEAL